jgi:hypothetical protein
MCAVIMRTDAKNRESSGKRCVCRHRNSHGAHSSDLRRSSSTTQGCCCTPSAGPSMAALTNNVCSCSSDCVIVQHPWSLYFSHLAAFSLANSGVSNFPTRRLARLSTSSDRLLSMAVKCVGISPYVSRHATNFAPQASWMCPKQCILGFAWATAAKRLGIPALVLFSV